MEITSSCELVGYGLLALDGIVALTITATGADYGIRKSGNIQSVKHGIKSIWKASGQMHIKDLATCIKHVYSNPEIVKQIENGIKEKYPIFNKIQINPIRD